MRDDDLEQQAASWRKTHEQALTKPRAIAFSTDSGIPVKELYTPLDLAARGFDYRDDLGFPGEFPFTRGADVTGYRDKIYGIGQYAGFATARDTNRLFKKLIAEGQDSIHVACDLPTNMGYDIDHPLAEGEIGRVGLTISSLADMEEFLDGIDLRRIGVTYVVNPIAPVILAMHIAVARKQGVPLDLLTGCVQNDVMKEYTACGKYIFPPRQAVRLSADIIEYVTEKMPRFYANNIALYHLGEAGADQVQQVAFALAAAIEYCDAVTQRGLPIDRFARNIAFLGYVNHRDLLCEVAKIRAMRRLWAELMKTRYGATLPESMTLKMHCAQGGICLTAGEGLLNFGRITLAALVAALAGVVCARSTSRTASRARRRASFRSASRAWWPRRRAPWTPSTRSAAPTTSSR
ncbi:MAG: hypothetical protein HYY95_07350 [Candidatus Rokubacteria bacterium]|nr:hypothetical protein [Candidatus Rokubacteria bacterium]